MKSLTKTLPAAEAYIAEHLGHPEGSTYDEDTLVDLFYYTIHDAVGAQRGLERGRYIVSQVDLSDVAAVFLDDPEHFVMLLTALKFKTSDHRERRKWRKLINALEQEMPLTTEHALRGAFRESQNGHWSVKISHGNLVTMKRPFPSTTAA